MHRSGAPAVRRQTVAVAGLIAGGVASLAVAHGLGYDAWSWMVWARELVHGTLSTHGGPSLKALPVLLDAPLTLLGGAAPLAWLAIARVSALLALLLAWRIGTRLAGPVAGWTAALALAVSPDLGATALYGSSEPLLVLLVLAAVDRHLHDRRRHAFVLLGLAGLIRPELWPIVLVLALAQWRSTRRLDPLVVACVAVSPAIWLALAWLGTGSALTQVIDPFAAPAATPCTHCVAHLLATGHRRAPAVAGHGLAALVGAISALALPALLIAAVGAIDALRRRDRDVVLLAALGVGWVLIVVAMTQLGYPGSRRYFAGPAALFALVAGVGVARLCAPMPRRWARAAALAVAVLVGVSALPAMLKTTRLVGVARAQDSTVAQLGEAIALAGGRAKVLAFGCPAINPWRQSALAWQLDTPLAEVQATWHSTHVHPHWRPPAIIFRGPGDLTGAVPALPRHWVARLIGRVGAWTILRATAGANALRAPAACAHGH
ncbi:MAG: hypothetical protein QOJ35_1037 [Solirubrobacteraceae bacterium]|jgi:hypothetical protein|nr:hypothetical protein [Solirubrobacteraceae bacterium]